MEDSTTTPAEGGTPKPRVRAEDVRFNVHLAGVRAGQRAAAEGGGADAETLVGAAAGGASFGGLELPPLVSGALSAIRKAGKMAADAGRDVDSELQLLIYCCARPAAAWRAMRDGAADPAGTLAAIETEAEELCFDLTLAEMRGARDWINAQVEAVQAKGEQTHEGEKKPAAPATPPTPSPPPSPGADTETPGSTGR